MTSEGMATPIVEPLASAAAPAAVAPVAPTESTPAEAGAGGLPPELMQIPAIQAVLVGSPPAMSMTLKGSEDREEVKLLTENKDTLIGLGFGFYRSLDGKTGVMFNGMRIHAEDLKAADKAGKLRTVAPDFDILNHEVAKAGPAGHPVLSAKPMTGFAAPTAASPPQAASGSLPLMPPPSAAVQRKLAQQRVMNLQPGAPTSGPVPGAGRLLNQVLKQAV